MSGARRHVRGTWAIFRWPLAMAAVSLLGLTSALVGDGLYDLVSWFALGGITLFVVAAWLRAPGSARRREKAAAASPEKSYARAV